jgi:hypothetical protein
VTQPPPVQRGRLPEESGGTLDREDAGDRPRPTELLRLNELRPALPELPQPFCLDS